ncbi:MAG: MFS transporter [Betaproteobacteria bacterium]|nr:MFS transporter [Betaproteobacteria bacterium]
MKSDAKHGTASALRASSSGARRNIWLLAGSQAMQLSTNATLIAINGLAGLALASNKALATLPVSLWVIGGMLATMPASFYMKIVGRQRGLAHGSVFGIAGALVSAAAISVQSLWLLCFGALLFGAQNAFGQYYRFAAADSATPDFKSSAISLVLAGGVIGGILGPGTSRFAVDLLPQRFMGAYLALIAFALVTIALLRFTHIPEPAPEERTATGRPIAEIAAQPEFIVAMLAGAVGYGVMYFLMTSAPIAMDACGHPYGDAAFVVSWHVIAMFAPAFITGPLIKRCGVVNIMLAGALMNVASVGIALSGDEVAHFWWSLVLNGVGWNFLYVGGTTLLTETYRPEEKAKAQGTNDLLIFATMSISSFVSGLIITEAGWEAVNLSALPLVAIVIVAIAWLAPRYRCAPAV